MLILRTKILADFNPLQSVVSEPLFEFTVGPLHIIVSNHMFTVTVAMVLLLIAVPLAARQRKMVPTGLKNLVESICVFLRDEVAKPLMGSHTDQYVYFIWTVFFFILTLNLLAMIPLEKIIALIPVIGRENHFGGPATANIWITGAMALITFLMTHIAGIKQQGLWRYLVNLAPPVPWWLMPLIYVLEILSSLVRPFALAIRLFANIIAGHMVLGAILGMVLIFKSYGIAAASVVGVASVVIAVALSFLELLVAFIQAYIFAFLSALYIGSSISPEH
jgi:F-type H+-transporting ATPase subunit a